VDHKPGAETERHRIINKGGKIYTSQYDEAGPLRVFPGRLSVSRTIGDIEAKLPKFKGNPEVVIAEPDIKSFEIEKDHDFILIGSITIFY